MTSSTIAITLGILSLLGGALTAYIALRGQLAQVQVTREAQERSDLRWIVEDKNKDLAQLRADLEDLGAQYRQQSARLEVLEVQRIKDQEMIHQLQRQVVSLGGTI